MPLEELLDEHRESGGFWPGSGILSLKPSLRAHGGGTVPSRGFHDLVTKNGPIVTNPFHYEPGGMKDRNGVSPAEILDLLDLHEEDG